MFWVGWIFSGFFFVFFFERTRPAASMRPPCLIYLSTSSLWLGWGLVGLGLEVGLFGLCGVDGID